MKKVYTRLFSSFWGLLVLLLGSTGVMAQVADLPWNQPVTYNNPKTPALTIVTGSSWTSDEPFLTSGGTTNPGNAIDSDTSNFATLVRATLGGGTQRITVAVNETITASTANPYFVGFDIRLADVLNVSLGTGTFKIILYNGNTEVETHTLDNSRLLGLLGAGLLTGTGQNARVGFTFAPATAATFNRVKFEQYSPDILAVGSTLVYNLVLGKYAPYTYSALACNTTVAIAAPTHSVGVSDNSGSSGVINPYGAIDSDPATFTSIGGLSSALSGGINYGIKDVFGNAINSAGQKMFVGFDLENANLLGLLNASLLSNYSIQLYNNGSPVGGVQTGTGLLSANLAVVSGSGRSTLGFITDLEFDEVVLNVASALSTTPTKVYGLTVKKFCSSSLDCNELTTVGEPGHPIYINLSRTGSSALVSLGAITNAQNIINGSGSPATITSVANVIGSTSVSVANALEIYPAGSYAGFEVTSASLLQASVLGNAGISLEFYNSAVNASDPVYTTPGGMLAGVGVLTGSNTHTYGAVSPVDFDEVRLVINTSVATVDLGVLQIHSFKVQKACDEAVVCSTEGSLTQEFHGAVVNGARTRVELGAQVSLLQEALENTDHAIDNDPDNYTSMNGLAGVISTTSLSVASTSLTFPKGSFAGYEVSQSGGLIDLGLLGNNNIRIVTLKDGVGVDSAETTLGGLIDLRLLSSGTGRNVLGFYSKGAFDEIQIRLLRTVNIGTGFNLRVYGAVASSRYAFDPGAGVVCAEDFIRPDQNTGFINSPILGNTSTNDQLPAGITYSQTGSPVVPSGAVYTLNLGPDGQYNFTTDTEGVYTFSVKGCLAAYGTDCPAADLVISVLTRTAPNAPVAYNDFVEVSDAQVGTPIDVRYNDIKGNVDGTLGIPTIVSNPTKGTVTIVDGNIVYTPNPGQEGVDEFTYSVCETPSNLCATAVVRVHIIPTGSTNTTEAADDQYFGGINVNITGNVLDNDSDPEGDTQSIALLDLNGDGVPETAPTGADQDVNKSGSVVGKISMNAATGAFTFKPTTNFKGTVNVAMRVMDSKQATAQATLVLVIKDTPDLSPTNDFGTNGTNFNSEQDRDFVVNLWELVGGTALEDEKEIVVQFTLSSSFDLTVPGLTLSSSPQSGVAGSANLGSSSLAHNNDNWLFYSDGFFLRCKAKPGVSISPNSRQIIGLHIKRKAGSSNGVQNVSFRVVNYSGGEIKVDNNISSTKVSNN
jgi:hypothetical protein